MDSDSQMYEENMSFILLIEEYKVVLSKTQGSAVKKMKKRALQGVIAKWSTSTGKTLSEKAIMKKLSNLKVRAKRASIKGQPLDGWEKKLLELLKVRIESVRWSEL